MISDYGYLTVHMSSRLHPESSPPGSFSLSFVASCFQCGNESTKGLISVKLLRLQNILGVSYFVYKLEIADLCPKKELCEKWIIKKVLASSVLHDF